MNDLEVIPGVSKRNAGSKEIRRIKIIINNCVGT